MKQNPKVKAVSANLLSLPRHNFFSLLYSLTLFLFGLSLSFQTGYKLDLSQAYIFGFLTDYFIFYIRASDLLLAIFLIIIFTREYKLFIPYPTGKIIARSIILIAFILIWYLESLNKTLYFFSLIRLFFFITLITVVFRLASTSPKNFSNLVKLFSLGLISGSVISSIIGLIQFFSGVSPNISIIGSYFFNSLTPNIALGQIGNFSFLRAYGTSPHPNIFSLVLISSIVYLLFIFRSVKNHLTKLFYLFTLLLLLIAMFTAFSRAGILMFLSVLVLRFIKLKLKSQTIILIFVALAVVIPFYIFTNLTPESKSITERIELNLIGIKVFIDNFFFGVGPGNYLLSAQEYFFKGFNLRLFQPPHNFFILFLAEYGIIFFIFILYLTLPLITRLPAIFKSHTGRELILPLVVIYSYGLMVDHYFMTSFQAIYLFGVLIGLILALNKMLDLD